MSVIAILNGGFLAKRGTATGRWPPLPCVGRRAAFGRRPSSPAVADRPGGDYTSVCSAISSASSTSIPRYLTVLSSLL